MFAAQLLLVVCAVAAARGAVFGLDMSQPINRANADCMVAAGFRYAIPRGWLCVNGAFDQAGVTTFNHLKAAGMAHVGIVRASFAAFTGLVICVGGAAEQIDGLKAGLDANGVVPDSVWLDIEGGGRCAWEADFEAHKAFYQEFLARAEEVFGADNVGVYSGEWMWLKLFGSKTWTNAGDAQRLLWNARYDWQPNFDSFNAFSSWQTPHIKQYAGNVKVCNFNVDVNYAPAFFGLTDSPSVPEFDVSCNYNGQSGKCQTQGACGAHPWIASADGASGCQNAPSAYRCCVVDGDASPVACTVGLKTGECKTTGSCMGNQGTSHPSSTGGDGCQALPADVQCCIPCDGDCSHPCMFGGQSGLCKDTSVCTGSSHPSSTGATGCITLPAAVQCCLEGAAETQTPCTDADGVDGLCDNTADCAQVGGRSTPSASGAAGCEPFPANVQCCTQQPEQPQPSTSQQQQPPTTAAANQQGTSGADIVQEGLAPNNAAALSLAGSAALAAAAACAV